MRKIVVAVRSSSWWCAVLVFSLLPVAEVGQAGAAPAPRPLPAPVLRSVSLVPKVHGPRPGVMVDLYAVAAGDRSRVAYFEFGQSTLALIRDELLTGTSMTEVLSPDWLTTGGEVVTGSPTGRFRVVTYALASEFGRVADPIVFRARAVGRDGTVSPWSAPSALFDQGDVPAAPRVLTAGMDSDGLMRFRLDPSLAANVFRYEIVRCTTGTPSDPDRCPTNPVGWFATRPLTTLSLPAQVGTGSYWVRARNLMGAAGPWSATVGPFDFASVPTASPCMGFACNSPWSPSTGGGDITYNPSSPRAARVGPSPAKPSCRRVTFRRAVRNRHGRVVRWRRVRATVCR